MSFGSVDGKFNFSDVGVCRIGGTGFFGNAIVVEGVGVGGGGGNSDTGVEGMTILIFTVGSSAGRYIKSASLSIHQRTSWSTSGALQTNPYR